MSRRAAARSVHAPPRSPARAPSSFRRSGLPTLRPQTLQHCGNASNCLLGSIATLGCAASNLADRQHDLQNYFWPCPSNQNRDSTNLCPKLHFNETAARKQELRLRAAGLSHKWLTVAYALPASSAAYALACVLFVPFRRY